MASAWGASWGDAWGNSWGTSESDELGHKVRQFRYVVEVDNQFIGVNTIEEARQVLANAETLAIDAAAADTQSGPVTPPRIRVKSKGSIPRSLRRQAENTQRSVENTYKTAYETKHSEDDDDEDDTIHVLLM